MLRQRAHKTDYTSDEDETRKVDTNETDAEQPALKNAGDDADARFTKIEAKATEFQELYLRAVADLKNVKRRHYEEAERIRDTATKELVLSLLPVVDDLTRALQTARATENDSALVSGVELVLSKLLASLESVGVEPIPGVGAEFDPAIHEAVMQTEPTREYPHGIVSSELRIGYMQHGHVLRPSMVAVAHD